jgi:5-methylcytosine-specific restriction endonuclease McrA
MAKPILARLGIALEDLPRDRHIARKSGYKWFFTGKPCKRGHLAARLVSAATYMECHRLSVIAKYQSDPQPHIERVMEYQRKIFEADPISFREEKRIYRKEWRLANPERERFNWTIWQANNREKLREGERRRYALNPEKHRLETKLWRLNNPEKVTEQFRAWCRANPDKVRVYDRNKRARRRSAEGRHTAADIDRIRKAQKDRCAYCRSKLDGKGHVDHIKALARGGSNWPRNLQLLCVPCNSAKSASDPLDFARKRGKLL